MIVGALFDHGEILLCKGPIFVVIAAIGIGPLLNSLPNGGSKKENVDE
jgi:hypothetical protein